MSTLMVVSTPISLDTVLSLRAGQQLSLCGEFLMAGREGCERLLSDFRAGRPLPVPLAGRVWGLPGLLSLAQQTDRNPASDLLPILLAQELRAVLGGGSRSPTVRYALRKYKVVGLTPVDEETLAAASERTIVAYPELGDEGALLRVQMCNLEVVVIEDTLGGIWKR